METRDAKAAADMIFAHDAKASRHSQLFTQVGSLFVADNSNRRKKYPHELLDLHMEIEETHPEDAARMFHLLGATLKEQHDAQQSGEFVMSAPEINVRFKALLPCEPLFYEFRKLSSSTHQAHRKQQADELEERHKQALELKRALIHEIWRILTEEKVPADPTAAAKRINEDIAKRYQAKKHQRVGLYTQQDLNDLIIICYILLRWATGRRREEILNTDKDYAWEQVEGNPYLMRAKLAKKRCALANRSPTPSPCSSTAAVSWPSWISCATSPPHAPVAVQPERPCRRR